MSVDWSQFQDVAVMSLTAEGEGVVVELADEELSKLDCGVYAWRDDAGTVLRVGTSKQPIGKRLLAYTGHINKSLAGLKSPTPLWEAERWLHLAKLGRLTAVYHQPPVIETVAGRLRRIWI